MRGVSCILLAISQPWWSRLIATIGSAVLLFHACVPARKHAISEPTVYEKIRDSLRRTEDHPALDTENIFDSRRFIPGQDSFETLLQRMDTQWSHEASLLAQLDTMTRRMQKKAGYSKIEKDLIRENLRMIREYLSAKDATGPSVCEGPGCILYAVVDKRRQLLFLHLFGAIRDSFPVSTGVGPRYDTPVMSLHPQGPLLVRYSSRKFPGGDYKGLGNMPYAVFLEHGYAIHGTTPGNFSKLGTPASHGCIRLHPDHAKLFHALVKAVGLRQTWVAVLDSLPAPVTLHANE